MLWNISNLLSILLPHVSCQFFNCHDDPGFEPEEGTIKELQFTWLGVLQYIHAAQAEARPFGTLAPAASGLSALSTRPKKFGEAVKALKANSECTSSNKKLPDLDENTYVNLAIRYKIIFRIRLVVLKISRYVNLVAMWAKMVDTLRLLLGLALNCNCWNTPIGIWRHIFQLQGRVKNGTPHYFRVPRVVLISRQFALSTAVDAAQVPDGYALGNVVFGDYERDESECRVTTEEIAAGAECEPAVLLMPIADVLLHPEYKHFGATNSIALLKMITTIRSVYMLPICLPFKNFILDKNKKQTSNKFYHVDFISDVPRDFVEEDKEATRVNLLPRELCFLYDNPENETAIPKNAIACTTGCGFHSGAPTVIHEHTGHWSMIAISQGGSPCLDPLRYRRPPAPPRHILLHPYVPWITAAITGKAVGAFSKDDPFGFIMPRASLYDTVGHGWNGHWWMGGLRCYDRGDAADDIFKFYHEIFRMKPQTDTFMTYYLEINAAQDSMIICIKVGVPYRLAKPKVWDLDSPETRVRIPVLNFQHMYTLQVEAWAYNSTSSSESSPSSSSSSSDYSGGR